jgi:hypothetical protein
MLAAETVPTQVTNAGARSAFPGFCSEDELLRRLAEAGYPLKRATLTNWRTARQGPPWTKFGRLVLYPEVELRTWLTSNMVKPARERRTVSK